MTTTAPPIRPVPVPSAGLLARPGLLALALAVLMLAGCSPDPGLHRLEGVWVVAKMQSASSEPVDNPNWGFRFTATELVVRKPDSRFVAPYSVEVVNESTLKIHAENEDTKQVQDLQVEFVGPDAAKFTIGTAVAHFVRVPADSVDLDFDND